jgi:hypothetical protein
VSTLSLVGLACVAVAAAGILWDGVTGKTSVRETAIHLALPVGVAGSLVGTASDSDVVSALGVLVTFVGLAAHIHGRRQQRRESRLAEVERTLDAPASTSAEVALVESELDDLDAAARRRRRRIVFASCGAGVIPVALLTSSGYPLAGLGLGALVGLAGGATQWWAQGGSEDTAEIEALARSRIAESTEHFWNG